MGDENLVVNWSDGDRPTMDCFPFVWLRDNCQCPECFHPVSKGRLFLMRDLEVDIKAEAAEHCPESGKVRCLHAHTVV